MMAKKKNQAKNQADKQSQDEKILNQEKHLSVGGSYVTGNVKVNGGGSFVGRDQVIMAETTNTYIQTSFRDIYKQIGTLSQTTELERQFVKATVEEIESESQKGEKANDGFLYKRLQNLKKVAPDILEVVLATLGNPAAGLGLVMTKITKRMAADKESNS